LDAARHSSSAGGVPPVSPVFLRGGGGGGRSIWPSKTDVSFRAGLRPPAQCSRDGALSGSGACTDQTLFPDRALTRRGTFPERSPRGALPDRLRGSGGFSDRTFPDRALSRIHSADRALFEVGRFSPIGRSVGAGVSERLPKKAIVARSGRVPLCPDLNHCARVHCAFDAGGGGKGGYFSGFGGGVAAKRHKR
jgi:hypothetical protein